MKYYYIMIDKVNKTLELIEAYTCDATTFEAWMINKGLNKQYQSWQLATQFKLYFNNQDNFINYDNIPKYARKFTII